MCVFAMGKRQSIFREEELQEYEDCTYFTRREILRLYHRFRSLNPDKINGHAADVATRLSFKEVQCMPELKENPFKVTYFS